MKKYIVNTLLMTSKLLVKKNLDGAFLNKTGLYDGNVYGMVFNSLGVVIGDFKPMRDNKTIGNQNITIKNTTIENIISDATEVASLYNKLDSNSVSGYGGAFGGPAGDVFSFLDNINDIYICPNCHNNIVISDTTIICENCSIKYKIDSGIPNFIIDK